MMDNILHKYTNGNTEVTILNDGTKIREYEDTPLVVHPESIDVKITNYCDLNCKYCHENSTVDGKHADLDKLQDILQVLPAGVELAIGGGNPLSHPDLLPFLNWCKVKGYICNITVNQKHLYQYNKLITQLIELDLVKGIGISITMDSFNMLKSICRLSSNVVFHVIAGVNKVEVLDELIKIPKCKVLILGYKTFGRGIDYYSEDVKSELNRWYQQLPKYIGKCIISFDNLAIEQLNVKRLFTDKGWNQFYMGDDFVFTMYIDAVKQMYAPTSRTGDRQSFKDYNLLEYFSTFRN